MVTGSQKKFELFTMIIRNQNPLIKDINSYTTTFKICLITIMMSGCESIFKTV